jgi:hypothetical protein
MLSFPIHAARAARKQPGSPFSHPWSLRCYFGFAAGAAGFAVTGVLVPGAAAGAGGTVRFTCGAGDWFSFVITSSVMSAPPYSTIGMPVES